MKYLLDSDVVNILCDDQRTAHHGAVHEKISLLADEDSLQTSVLVLYELEYSFYNAPDDKKLPIRNTIHSILRDFDAIRGTPSAVPLQNIPPVIFPDATPKGFHIPAQGDHPGANNKQHEIFPERDTYLPDFYAIHSGNDNRGESVFQFPNSNFTPVSPCFPVSQFPSFPYVTPSGYCTSSQTIRARHRQCPYPTNLR